MAPTTLSQTTTQTRIKTITTTKTVTELEESQKLSTQPVRHVERQNPLQRNATMEPMQRIDRLTGKEDQKDRIRSKREPTKMIRMKQLEL